MLVLHLAKTPLVGSPYRVCQALSNFDDVKARSVVLNPSAYSDRSFDSDLTWDEDREEIIELIDQADILHLHNYIHLDSTDFSPVNFRRYWNSGKVIVRQFHSHPQHIAKISGETVNQINSCPIPKLVLAQYHERYYAQAKIVPNIVFDSVDTPNSLQRNQGILRICYSPSTFHPARSQRWDTKGYPETIKLLKWIKKSAYKQGTPVEIDVIEQVSHAECLRRKALADIAIDDLVTGSYHMSTLESLVLGSAVFTFMDQRVLQAIQEVSGRQDFPALNVPLEEAKHVILELIKQPELVRLIGIESRQWMLDHWSPEKMAGIFLRHYNEVLKAPKKTFAPRFSTHTPASHYRNIELYDGLWKARQPYWPKELPPVVKKTKSIAGNFLRYLGLR